MNPHAYGARFYRKWQKPPDLKSSHVHVDETDLQIFAEKDVAYAAEELVVLYRRQIEDTVARHPEFGTSLEPVSLSSPYPMIRDMVELAARAGVGPLAGVAGAVAEYVGRDLLTHSRELIVENGGDLFLKTLRDRTMLVYGGEQSPFRNKLRLKLKGGKSPYGVCTSSATVGHSLSLGGTDATVIIAASATAADVFATALGNRVKEPSDLVDAFRFLDRQGEISGALILIQDRLGVWGDIELE
jgi:ApbE superfamily uncharacterized protein (UPF0280 family)